VNAFTGTEPSPLVQGLDELAFEKANPADEAEQLDRLTAWKSKRDHGPADLALDELREAAAQPDENLVPFSIQCARAGVTTGEWSDALREVFGEYRGPTGVTGRAVAGGPRTDELAELAERVQRVAEAIGAKKLRMLVGKPGLDGHSNAAEQVAVRARDAGMEVIYQGIRLTPAEIAQAAVDEDVNVVALSILSGAHNLLVPEVMERLRDAGVDLDRVPVVVGGVIPDDDAAKFRELGVAAVFTPRDHDLTAAIGAIADLVAERANGAR
jgi:(2R)-ethylmalonyl-CoA mutase